MQTLQIGAVQAHAGGDFFVEQNDSGDEHADFERDGIDKFDSFCAWTP
jgi:hypothetical protein